MPSTLENAAREQIDPSIIAAGWIIQNYKEFDLGGVRGALAIPVPTIIEQKRIVAEVERRMSVIDQLEAVITANLQRATCLRQSILARAFHQHGND